MVWMVVPLRLSLTRWRLLLLVAFALLAGAMGGSDAAARVGIVQIAGRCQDQDGCGQRLTAPSQPALIQVALRIDGKALTGGSDGVTGLPGEGGIPALPLLAVSTKTGFFGTLPRKVASRPGQPRGPPAGR